MLACVNFMRDGRIGTETQEFVNLTIVLAMICAFIGLQPKEYDKYDHNLTEMRKELRKIIQYKSRGFRAASVLFVLGCLLLVALLIAVILM